jgi:hypothetical protein
VQAAYLYFFGFESFNELGSINSVPSKRHKVGIRDLGFSLDFLVKKIIKHSSQISSEL